MAMEFDCRSMGMDCPFMVRSEDDREVVEMVQQHAQNTHDKRMSESDVRDGMRSA